jgi:hypothetical protein
VRRFLNDGRLPPRDAVRIEEMVNYFDYNYALPATRERPFEPSVAVYPAPWNAKTEVLHIGIQGYGLPQGERPPVNLVLLLDVSGSMEDPDKLIVVYAGNAGVVLEPTAGNETLKITQAIDNLSAGGSTAGGEGIRRAYELAEANLIKGGVNRVILATDGDFNVGITDPQQLEDFVARKRESGVTLTVLGFGAGVGAVLAVAGDVEDRAELVLHGEGLLHQFFAAGVVVDGGQEGEGLLALEQHLIGVGVLGHGGCSRLVGSRRLAKKRALKTKREGVRALAFQVMRTAGGAISPADPSRRHALRAAR